MLTLSRLVLRCLFLGVGAGTLLGVAFAGVVYVYWVVTQFMPFQGIGIGLLLGLYVVGGFGAVYGAILGVLNGLVTSLISWVWFRPVTKVPQYHFIVRLTTTLADAVVVFSYQLLWFRSSTPSRGTGFVIAVLLPAVLAGLGAWVISPWVTQWYEHQSQGQSDRSARE